MAEPAKRNANCADMQALPEGVAGKFVFCALDEQPSPVPQHGSSQLSPCVELGGLLRKRRGGPGGRWFAIKPDLHPGPHVQQRDIACSGQARVPQPSRRACVELAPDRACEILSPSTEGTDCDAKRRIYATYGVGRHWYLRPGERYLEVSALGDGAPVHVDTFDDPEEFRAPSSETVALQRPDPWPIPTAPDQT